MINDNCIAAACLNKPSSLNAFLWGIQDENEEKPFCIAAP